MRDEDLEKYKKPDGTIDFGRYAEDQLSIINNQLSKKGKDTKTVEELSVFKVADELSNQVWNIVSQWDYFAKKTVGGQWVRSTDSIAANITEGYGRYFFGEYIIFLYYARGSAHESKFWLEKAHKRKLINNQLYQSMKQRIEHLPLEINKVIKIIKTQRNKWKGRPKY